MLCVEKYIWCRYERKREREKERRKEENEKNIYRVYIYIYFYLLSKQTFNWLFIIYTCVHIYIHIYYVYTYIYYINMMKRRAVLIARLRELRRSRVPSRGLSGERVEQGTHTLRSRRIPRDSMCQVEAGRIAERKRKIERSKQLATRPSWNCRLAF